jgi:hypothetical protein
VRTLPFMQLQHYKVALAALWALAVSTVGVVVGVTSMPPLVILAIVALLPPIVMLRLWRDPVQSMSESIQDARR